MRLLFNFIQPDPNYSHELRSQFGRKGNEPVRLMSNRDVIMKALAHKTVWSLKDFVNPLFALGDLFRYERERTQQITAAVTSITEFCAQRDRLCASSPSFRKFKEAMRVAKLYARDVAKRYDCGAKMATDLKERAKRAGSPFASQTQGSGVPQSAEELLEGKLNRFVAQLVTSQTPKESEEISDEERSDLEQGGVTTREVAVKKADELWGNCLHAFTEWKVDIEYKGFEEKKKAMYSAISGINTFCAADELYKHPDLTQEAAARLQKMIV